MRSASDILGLYHARADALAPAHAAFRAIREAMLGNIDVPLPELDRNEQASVANLILVGVTQTANRIASTMPTPYYPPLRPGIDLSETRARVRRARVLDLYDKNALSMIMRKRAIHYLSYAAAPVVLKPNPRYHSADDDSEQPTVTWENRDPLASYTAELHAGQCVPDDAIFAYTRSYRWVENRYGYGILADLALSDPGPDTPITLLEYIDADTIGLYALGAKSDRGEPDPGPIYGVPGLGMQRKGPVGKPIVPVSVIPNRAGRPLCVVAGSVSLERPQSMYEGLVGLLQNQSQMMALERIGMMRSIWPEEWLQTRPGETANVITQADPLAGIMGEVSGAELKLNSPTPSQFGVNLIDRIERAMRVEAGIPAEYGGESGTNIRTDKRGNSILSATIDFNILAAHEAFQLSMREENRIVAAIEKTYFAGKRTFAGVAGTVTYDPVDVWEDHAPGWVRYPSAGSDADSLVVAGGQRLGIGTMSKLSFMMIDPLVDDPELETERVRSEQLEAMLFANLAAVAQNDPNYMTVIARLNEKLREDRAVNIMATWLELDKEYKAEQAQAQQQAAAPPAALGGPADAQPGLAEPGAAINAPPQSLSALGQLTQVLRHTSRSPQPPVPVAG